jgi:hypothetical protein
MLRNQLFQRGISLLAVGTGVEVKIGYFLHFISPFNTLNNFLCSIFSPEGPALRRQNSPAQEASWTSCSAEAPGS